MNNKQISNNNQQIYFYGWLDENGNLEYQKGYKSSKPIRYAKINSDWMCIASHRSAWYKDSDGNRVFGKTTENIHSVYYSFLDIDCNHLVLTSDIIKQRCNALDLPYPTYIINTSPNHFHLLWKLKKPVINRNHRILSYWDAVQKLLYKAFQDLGADPKCLDPNRYLRNPYNKHQINTKYTDKPSISIENTKEYTSLDDLYGLLVNAGYTPKNTVRVTTRNKTPYEISKRKLYTFLRKNPKYHGTYKDLSELVQIPERTLYLICKWFEENGVISRFTQRIGNTWNTIICFLKVDTASKSNSLSTYKNNSFNYINTFKNLVVKVAEKGISPGNRNSGYFVLILFLKNFEKWNPDRITRIFEPGALKKHFKLQELRKIVSSIFRNDYKNTPTLHSENFKHLQRVMQDV